MIIESNSEQNPDNLKGYESLLRDFESLVKAEKLFVQELSHALRFVRRCVVRPVLTGNVEIKVIKKPDVLPDKIVKGTKVSDPSVPFKFTSDFVRQRVETIVNEIYSGSHSDLALIEVALFDHGLLKRRNAHTAFLKALAAWNIIEIADDKELQQFRKGITDKFRRLPQDGYKKWGADLLNEKNTCICIGQLLGDTIPYIR